MKKNKTTYILSYDKVFNKNGKQILINCLKNISKKKNLAKKKIYLDGRGSRRIADYITSTEFNHNTQVN